MTFSDELKNIIREKHLLNHPFYQMWNAGTLPIRVMQKYAAQYFHLESAFPTFLSRMHADADFETRQVITENLAQEELGEQNHRELWLRYAEGIGANRSQVMSSDLLPETQQTIDTFSRLAGASVSEGAAALAAYESQIPEVAETKIQGLKKHYGVSDERTLQFFRVHQVLDVAHSDAWWNMLESVDEAEKDSIRVAVKEGRDALWGFLDGICCEYSEELPACA